MMEKMPNLKSKENTDKDVLSKDEEEEIPF